MRLYKGMTELPAPPVNAVATIGNFDGVHLGHRDLVGKIVANAKKIGGTSVVITFRPHPHFVLRPTEAPLLLNTYEEKLALLADSGVDVIIEEPFSREFSNITPDQFVNQFLVRGLEARVLYLGYDFAFGKERSGSVETLERLAEARGIEIRVVPPLKVDGHPVSSSLIRKTLDSGEIEIANRYLGRAFFLTGLVWRGEGRGRTIGVPTANLQTVQRKYPRTGVYATRTRWRGRWYRSVSNVGYNPTFKGDGTDLPLKIETHLFDFDDDMYGDEICVEFYAFLRPEQKFPGVDALLKQMQTDFAEAKKILADLGY